MPDALVLELLGPALGHDLTAIGLAPPQHEAVVGGLLATREVVLPATDLYLAVKRLPAAEQPSMLARFDARREELFDVYADVLDEICGSAPLQHLVGRIVAQIAFSSRFAVRLPLDAASGEDLGLAPEEQPDARLQRLLDALVDTTSSLDDVVGARHAQATGRVGLAPWDLHDEHAWRDRRLGHPEAMAVVEQELAQMARPWLVHVADLPCLVDDELEQARSGLEAWVASATTAPLPRG